MKKLINLGLIVFAVMAISTEAPAEPPAVPSTPAAVDDLVYARTFTLEQGYRFDWSEERPLLTEGTLLVLKVDPALVYPRQAAEPVLFVGNQTAERVNIGYRSGHVIAIVPGKVDLSRTPIWFGTPELPERVSGNIALAERAVASEAGIKPFSTEKVKAAYARGGKGITLSDRDSLRPVFAGLLSQFSSVETELIDTFNVPVTR